MRRYLPIFAVLVSCLLVTGWGSRSDALPLESGDILVTNSGGTFRVNPFSGTTDLFSPIAGTDIESGPPGIFLTTGTSVIRLDPTNGGGTVLSSGGLFQSLLAIDLASDGTIFVLNRTGGIQTFQVIKVNSKTGIQSLLADISGRDFNDLAIDPTGFVFVGSENGTVDRIDPVTGMVLGILDLAHNHAIDFDSSGEMAVAGNSHIDILFSPSGSVFACGFARDVAYGAGGNLFFTGGGDPNNGGFGVFLAHKFDHLVNSCDPSMFTQIAPDLTGRLTVFVPAPPTLLLLLMGLIGLGVFARAGYYRSK
jgi:hypothetical protein